MCKNFPGDRCSDAAACDRKYSSEARGVIAKGPSTPEIWQDTSLELLNSLDVVFIAKGIVDASSKATVQISFYLFSPLAELLRAVVYQLHKWKVAAALQPHHVHSGARGVPEGGHRVEFHWLWPGSAALHWPHREAGKKLVVLLSSKKWLQ